MRQTTTHLLPATVHGRYLLEEPATPTGGLLVGFHGYAETADTQLARLRALPGSDAWTLASIQALHPFYRGRSEEVVASWMTRLDRERAIADNIAYVLAVVAALRRRLPPGPTVYAGFSQGVAMAFRAALADEVEAAVLALGGDVPPELLEGDRSRWRGRFVLLARGSAEPWLSEARFAADIAALEAAGAEVTPVVFEGGHEWNVAFCERVAPWLEARAQTRPADV